MVIAMFTDYLDSIMRFRMLSHKVALLVLLILGVAASGCCCCSDVPVSPSLPSASGPGSITFDDDIAGTWSSEGPYGTFVDPATGAATGSAANGEWYAFRADGTYRYVIISSGISLSGGVARDGRYRLDGDEIVLYDSTESWSPDMSRSGQTPAYRNKDAPDERFTIEFVDEDTLTIGGQSFYRIVSD